MTIIRRIYGNMVMLLKVSDTEMIEVFLGLGSIIVAGFFWEYSPYTWALISESPLLLSLSEGYRNLLLNGLGLLFFGVGFFRLIAVIWPWSFVMRASIAFTGCYAWFFLSFLIHAHDWNFGYISTADISAAFSFWCYWRLSQVAAKEKHHGK